MDRESDPVVIESSSSAGPSRAKRPRIGRSHTEILGPIEADTTWSADRDLVVNSSSTVEGRARRIRGLLLHVGENRLDERYGGGSNSSSSSSGSSSSGGMGRTLQRQAVQLLEIYKIDPEQTVDLLFEG